MFSCEFCEISRNIFFTEHLWTTASEKNIVRKLFANAKVTTRVRKKYFCVYLIIKWRLIFANVIRFSRLRLWCFWWMFFSSIKRITRVISKGMSNIYLEVTIDKKLTFLNFSSQSLKNMTLGPILGSCKSRSYHGISRYLFEIIILILKGIMAF